MRKLLSILLAGSLVISGAVSNVSVRTVEAAAVTIGSLDYTYSGSSDVEKSNDASDLTLSTSKYGSKKNGYKFSKGSGKVYASLDGSSLRKLEWSDESYKDSSSSKKEPVMTAGKKNKWVKGSKPYFEIVTSSKGYENIKFSAYIGASKKGIKKYYLAYATGSSTSFTKISGASLSLSDNRVMQKISCSLPSGANNNSKLKIRIYANGLSAVGGCYVYDNPTGGEVAINHVLFKGSKKTTSVSKAVVKKVKLNKTTVSLKKGKKIKLKAKISFSSGTKAQKKDMLKGITWVNYNKKVIKMEKKGKKVVLKAKKKGSAVITVRCGTKSATCQVNVK